jgi:hypothetical protein
MNSASLLPLLLGLLLFGTGCSDSNEPPCDPPPAATTISGPVYSSSGIPNPCGSAPTEP